MKFLLRTSPAAMFHPAKNSASNSGIQHGLAARNLLDGFDQRLAANFLEQIPIRTRGYRIENRLIVRVGSKHQRMNILLHALELPADIEAAFIAQSHVQQHYIRLNFAGSLHGFKHSASFPNDLQLRKSLQHRAQTDTNDLVVIDDEQADFHGQTL